MKTGLFVTTLLAAVATASPATADDPPPNGSQMIQYCDSENMQGPCTNLDDSVRMNCSEFMKRILLEAASGIELHDGLLTIALCHPPQHRINQGL